MNKTISVTTSSTDHADRHEVGETIVTAVADVQDISPLDVEPPLATVINPDALNSVVESMSSAPDEPSARVEFPYNGYAIAVNEVGNVSVRELDDGRFHATDD